MANAEDPIAKYHKWVRARLSAWGDHVNASEKVLKSVTGNSPDYSFRQMTGDVLSLWLGCYDAAYGWLYPSSDATPDPAQPPAKGASSGKASSR